jgi:hypothetical protein
MGYARASQALICVSLLFATKMEKGAGWGGEIDVMAGIARDRKTNLTTDQH